MVLGNWSKLWPGNGAVAAVCGQQEHKVTTSSKQLMEVRGNTKIVAATTDCSPFCLYNC